MEPPEIVPGVGRKMAKGAGWTIAARLSVQGIGFLSTIVLARLLAPEDFGLVALATTLSAALLAVTEFTFDVVLIQNRNAGRSYYDTAWTLQLWRNAILALILMLGASLFASMLGDARLENILYFLAGAVLVEGFQNVGIVEFRKHFQFHKDYMFLVGGKMALIVAGIPLAILWGNYWALVAAIVFGACVKVALSYIMQSYRPRFSLAKWRNIIRFSKWLLMTQAGTFAFQRTDTFVIGRIVGAQGVGIYTIAYEIANLTTSTLLAPIRRAILPGFASVAHDMEGLRRSFVDVFAFALLMATPVAAGTGLVAEPLVHVVLGQKWLAAIPLIQVLAIYGFLSVASAGSGPVYMALGRPHLLAVVLGLALAVLLPVLIFGVMHWGALGAAWAVTLAVLVMALLDIGISTRVLRLRLRRLLVPAWRPLLAVALMIAVVLEVRLNWAAPERFQDWLILLLASVAAGAVTYIGTVTVLWFLAGRPDGAERHLLDALETLAQRYRARGRAKRGAAD
jgi:O-antigen/teichoic acid export membrane protein